MALCDPGGIRRKPTTIFQHLQRYFTTLLKLNYIRSPIGGPEDLCVKGLENLEENLNAHNKQRIENELIPIARKYILSHPLVLEGDDDNEDNDAVVQINNQSSDNYLSYNDRYVNVM